MPRSCYIQLSAAIDGSLSLFPSRLSSMRRIVAGIYDPLPTPTTVGSRGVTKVAFQNLFREISGLRKRGEKNGRRRERRRREEEEEKIACSRLWSRARPECRAFLLESRKWTTLAKLPATRHHASVFRFSFLPPILSLGQGTRQMAHGCPGCPVWRPRRQTF